MKKIGERVRELREELGVERKELARRAGMSYTALSDLELGKTANTTKLRKLAEALGADVDYLETGKGDPTHKTPSHSHHVRLDPEIVSDTHKALEKMYARANRNYPKQDVARFVHLYEIFALRNAGVPEAELFGAGLSDFMEQGVESERVTGMPNDGSHKGSMARRVRR